ncbi:hypothetical protein LOTGIDRAFT_157536 [Lottia gigantea]|uniref:Uncharacterized protein n=1 Tax=Lottia gigantea TaxID=225164 RepID=V4ABM0_LOTGI|nr:hypothetical protein LOTGIDRAFT_157536 [Lottia gigantea]ESP01359.1 hypothetical protein LOTGIDRAFT_157536 [Lottia gigantea]
MATNMLLQPSLTSTCLSLEAEQFLNDNSGAPSIEGIIGGLESGGTEEPFEVTGDIFDLMQQVETAVTPTAQPLMPPPGTPVLKNSWIRGKTGRNRYNCSGTES